MKNVIQFGTGAFLRGFFDWMMSEVCQKCGFKSKVTVIQSTSRGLADAINSHPEHTLLARGLEAGAAVVKEYRIDVLDKCINTAADYESFLALASDASYKYIVSNTTEAGIKYD